MPEMPETIEQAHDMHEVRRAARRHRNPVLRAWDRVTAWAWRWYVGLVDEVRKARGK